MTPIPQVDVFCATEFKVGFVQQCRWLKSVAWPLASHIVSCKSLQFRLHQLKEPLFSVAVPGAPTLKQLGDLSPDWTPTRLHFRQVILSQAGCEHQRLANPYDPSGTASQFRSLDKAVSSRTVLCHPGNGGHHIPSQHKNRRTLPRCPACACERGRREQKRNCLHAGGRHEIRRQAKESAG